MQLLLDDSVLAIWVPACVFLIAYAGTIWLRVVDGKARPGTWTYVAAAVGALALHLCWMAFAAGTAAAESVAVAPLLGLNDPGAATVTLAGDPSYLDYLNALAYLAGALAWPLVCALAVVVVRFVARNALQPPIRSVLAGVVVGSLATILPLLIFNTAEINALIPDVARIIGLPLLAVAAIVVLAAAGREEPRARYS